ncbi:MAG: CAP domain-containing protein [Paracoccus sp. (in: a-proteobacteria)]|uniref:CAP domain-containing protein n=1 Tax=Paracoccus sp. TaxID=267 RepID=UPI0026E06553|nr:CAP domain-containing protein [Paracoccus sp. (in: a-proteobacteria)]MDO5613663.1 CAP domain-containing protein [Paracoccus sp. (in: a-proteobacteria)]
MRFSALSVLMLLAVAACAPGDSADRGWMAPPDPNDPHDIQATAPGQAVCHRTSAADLAAGVAATNSARARAGLPPVRGNTVLARAAQQHACDMAERGRMAHVGRGTSGPSQRVKALGYQPRITAENIAAGPFSLNRVLAEWNSSSGHLANINIPQMQEMGIGRAVGSDGKTVFWAAVYAAPK